MTFEFGLRLYDLDVESLVGESFQQGIQLLASDDQATRSLLRIDRAKLIPYKVDPELLLLDVILGEALALL